MPFRKYTKCYAHTPGDKPFHEDDLVGLALLHGVLPAVLFGALTGLVAGLAVGGPIGAVVGLVVGIFSGVTVGLANALTEAAKRWRYHRLVCLTGVQCAIGTVVSDQDRGDLGDFDNDQFFNMRLMPHPDGTPNAKVFADKFQGEALMAQRIADLSFSTGSSSLHCEAEGDFWKRVSELALALGALAGLLAVATAGAAAAGAAAGFAAGCAIGGIFGPIGCLIGGIIGAIIGALLAGGAAAAVSALIMMAALQAIFDADPGDIEDANVGDTALGPIRVGDKVIVIGEHVYDGFHEGWHEFHPLMAIQRIGNEAMFYLERDPMGTKPQPPDHPDMPASGPDDITKMKPAEMMAGLNDPRFKKRAEWLKERWCDATDKQFDEKVREAQLHLTERWTIHPSVDGCQPAGDPLH
jgi:hypothetical protein